MTPRLYFEYSAWFFIVCLLIGAGYSIVLYYRTKTPWGTSTNKALFILRFTLVSLLAGLLVGPFLRLTENNFEKPLVVFAVDNSESMRLANDSITLSAQIDQLQKLIVSLEDGGYETRSRTLDQNEMTSGLDFNHEQTDLSQLMKNIANDFEGFNLTSVILYSDGIYNSGISPTYASYTYPVFTIGAGDTTKNKDIIIQNVLYNKLSYQGNKFPILVEILNEGYVGEGTSVSIIKDGNVIESKNISFSRNNQINRVEFLLEADKVGLQRYSIVTKQLSDEFTLINNSSQVFIDVIDGRENILIVASSPHPDVKSMVASIENNDNYEVNVHIPGINQLPQDLITIDLIIFHQIPDYRQALRSDLDRLLSLNSPKLFIVGSQSNITALNKLIAPINITRTRNESDLVTSVGNPDFSLFELSESLEELINKFPPVRAPFGNIVHDSESNILLNQRVGSITTTRPLMLFRNDQNKMGVFFAEGLWKWRLFDYAENSSNDLFDELILKTVQYLTTKDDKRKFRIYPRKNEFFEKESIVFQAEAYDALYEPLFGIKVELELTDEQNKKRNYTFVTSQSNASFTIPNMEAGIYRYRGTALVNSNAISASGEFLVKEMNVESINLTADHHLLKDLSTKTGGLFYLSTDFQDLEDQLISSKPPEIIHSTEQFLPLINLQWAFFILLLVVSSEWFIRKYQGGY